MSIAITTITRWRGRLPSYTCGWVIHQDKPICTHPSMSEYLIQPREGMTHLYASGFIIHPVHDLRHARWVKIVGRYKYRKEEKQEKPSHLTLRSGSGMRSGFASHNALASSPILPSYGQGVPADIILAHTR